MDCPTVTDVMFGNFLEALSLNSELKEAQIETDVDQFKIETPKGWTKEIDAPGITHIYRLKCE